MGTSKDTRVPKGLLKRLGSSPGAANKRQDIEGPMGLCKSFGFYSNYMFAQSLWSNGNLIMIWCKIEIQTQNYYVAW